MACPLVCGDGLSSHQTLASVDSLESELIDRAMKSIDEHIAKDETEILAAKAQGDEGKVRHLEGELKDLKDFKEHHPGDNHDPTSLEMFCENNPDSPECRIYDD